MSGNKPKSAEAVAIQPLMKSKIKKVVRFLFRHGRIRIRSGPCRGTLWSVATRSQFIRGTYEPNFTKFISEILTPGDIFWDVGAHMGYYTMLAAKIVQSGRCYAFEPSRENQWYLRHHISWNKSSAVPHSVALSDTDGTATFGSNYGTGSGHLGAENGRNVVVRSIDSLIEKGECRAPSVLKMDVEGAEMAVLKGAADLLRLRKTIFLIATHGTRVHQECVELLRSYGFSVRESVQKSTIIASPLELNKSDALLAIFN